MDSKMQSCGVKSAKVVHMIRTEGEIGTGTEKDPVRMAVQYWDLDGNLVFIDDEHRLESDDFAKGGEEKWDF